MPRRDLHTFQKTRLALTVAALCASLGACSSVPRDNAPGTVAEAGRGTTETGSRLWDRTLYVLGFGDDAGTNGASAHDPRPAGTGDAALLDEVDIALSEEDAAPPSASGEVVITPVRVDPATVAASSRLDGDAVDGERVRVDDTLDGDNPSVSTTDLAHEVGMGETLWDIAKMTTGDATNWHVLADVNDLAPDAAVYPGQTLVVPADLVRPEFVGFTTTADATAGADTGTTDRPAGDTGTAGDALVANLAADAAAEDRATGGTELRLAAGETLWDFAKRTTGDATNWRAIADANGFSEEKATRVYENMRITVPTALLREDEPVDVVVTPEVTDITDAGDMADAAGADAIADTATDIITDVEISAAPVEVDATAVTSEEDPADLPLADAADAEALGNGNATGADIADRTGEALAGVDPNQPIRIVEAAYRSENDGLDDEATSSRAATELATGAAAVAATGMTAGTGATSDTDALAGSEAVAGMSTEPVTSAAPQEIMVSGTYYPKAVYNDADFSSSLLMRVSPGTTLQVSRAVGPWYEVATEQGKGYVHARDIK